MYIHTESIKIFYTNCPCIFVRLVHTLCLLTRPNKHDNMTRYKCRTIMAKIRLLPSSERKKGTCTPLSCMLCVYTSTSSHASYRVVGHMAHTTSRVAMQKLIEIAAHGRDTGRTRTRSRHRRPITDRRQPRRIVMTHAHARRRTRPTTAA